MELITVKLFSSSRSVFSIPQPIWAGGGGYGEGRSSCCGWCRRKWWMLSMLLHGGKVILKNNYLAKTLTIHSAQQQVSRPPWFMDPRSRCTDCSLNAVTDMQVHWRIIQSITYGRQSNMDALKSTPFENAHMVYMLMEEA
ncbi:hypothetical protein ACQJBY_003153 [Aegilops geniculata]